MWVIYLCVIHERTEGSLCVYGCVFVCAIFLCVCVVCTIADCAESTRINVEGYMRYLCVRVCYTVVFVYACVLCVQLVIVQRVGQ